MVIAATLAIRENGFKMAFSFAQRVHSAQCVPGHGVEENDGMMDSPNLDIAFLVQGVKKGGW